MLSLHFPGLRDRQMLVLRGHTLGRRSVGEMILLATALAVAAFLRMSQIDLVEFKMDEAGWLAVASDWLDRGRLPQIGSVDPDTRNTMGIHIPPLMAYLMILPLTVSRSPVLATAFIALMNVLAVLLLYWSTSRYFGRLTGLLATLSYAVSTTAILYSRKIWSNYMLAPFAVLLFSSLLALFVDGRRWSLAATLFLLSWVVQLHVSSLPLALVFVAMAIVFRRELALKPAIVGLIPGILIWAPYGAWVVLNQADDLAVIVSFVAGRTTVTDLSVVSRALEMVTTGPTEIGVSVSAPRWIPAFRGFFWFDYVNLGLLLSGVTLAVRRVCVRSTRRAHRAYLLLLLWLVLPVLFAIRHSIEVQRFYLLPLQPALFGFIGLSAGKIVSYLVKRSSVIWRVALVLFCSLLLAAAWSQAYLFMAFLGWIENGNTVKAFGYPSLRYQLVAATTVSSESDERGSFVLVPGDVDTAKVFAYHFANRRVAIDVFSNEDTIILPMDERDPVLIVPSHHRDLLRQLEIHLPGADWRSVVSSGGELQFALIRGVHEALTQALTSNEFRPLSKHLANGLKLIGYRLVSGTWGESKVIGALVVVETERAERDAADYHFFNHLIDSSDEKVAQKDSASFSFGTWRNGDRRIFLSVIDLPPDLRGGLYRWRFGVYNLKDMRRLEMIDAASGEVTDSVDFGPILLP